MQKLATILLLALFGFNILGYQLLYNHMEQRADVALENDLDERRYNESELISIKQPTQLPYYTNSPIFERTDGEVSINGVIYKYVKRRIYNDSLEMLCIPNKAKMKIRESKTDYVKWATDVPQNGSREKKEGSSKNNKTSTVDYEVLSLDHFSLQQHLPLELEFPHFQTQLQDGYPSALDHPPGEAA